MYSGEGHRQQYGPGALHAGYLRPQIHTQYMQYLWFFHCINGCTNAPQRFVILYSYIAYIVAVSTVRSIHTFLKESTVFSGEEL
jgi:hypothetical protein